MLIQFTVGNFKSFKDKATLSLEATSDDWREEDNLAIVGDKRLLKAAAIYGPNAGGKSNFLSAMLTLCKLVRESSKDTQQGDAIPVTSFLLNSATELAPSFFEIVFLQQGTRYRYGFEATPEAIQSEWLFSQENSIRETRLFTREGVVIESTESFKEGKGLESRTRSNALFLSVAAQFNGEIAGTILNWMNMFRDISGLDDQKYMLFTATRLDDPEYGPLIRELVKQADIGIENLKREDVAPDQIPKLIPKGIPNTTRERLLQIAHAGGFLVKTFHQRFNGNNR
jgi:AAA15 family ATPase/GTPase